WNAAAVVVDGYGTIEMNGHEDLVAGAREVLIDGVVDGLPYEVMKARPIVNIPDVHARPLANRLEPFERSDALRVVNGRSVARARGFARRSALFGGILRAGCSHRVLLRFLA